MDFMILLDSIKLSDPWNASGQPNINKRSLFNSKTCPERTIKKT